MLRDFIQIRIGRPGSDGPQLINYQDRTFYEHRNKGFVLVHHAAEFPAHPACIESYPDLVQYHRPENVYSLQLRNTRHVSTYATALGVIADHGEPFQSINDLQLTKGVQVSVEGPEAILRKEFEATHVRVPQPLTFDGVLQGAIASAFVVSTPTLSDEYLKTFHASSHYVYFVLQRTRDSRIRSQWTKFFSQPVHLFIGIHTPPEPPLAVLAAELGVKLFIKRGARYFRFPR